MEENEQDHSWRDNLARLREKPKPWPAYRHRHYYSTGDILSSVQQAKFESNIPNLPKVHAAIRKNISPHSHRRSVPPLLTSHSDFETYLDPTVPTSDRFEKYMKDMKLRKVQERLFDERLQTPAVTKDAVAKGGGWKVLPKIHDHRPAERSPSKNSTMIYMPSITHEQWSPNDSI